MLSRLKGQPHPSFTKKREKKGENTFIQAAQTQDPLTRGIYRTEITGQRHRTEVWFPNKRDLRALFCLPNKIKRNEMVTKWLSLGLLWNFLQMFDWALQVGCMGSYRKFKLTRALVLLQWGKWHRCKLEPGVMFQMVCLGFGLNVSLNNESTNLRVFQIAWVSGYNRIAWPFYSSYKRGITGCEYQHWEIHAIKAEAQASGIHTGR